jgi:protein CpxP
MKTRMTPLSTAMLAASLLLATSTLSTPALAAPPEPPHGAAPEMQGDHKTNRLAGRQAERWEKRMADLHASLKLTPTQAPAWDTFHAAVKPPARAAQPEREDGRRGDWAKLKTPDRLDRLRAWRQERETAATQRDEATRTFYATLNPEQQKTFDARTAQPFFGDEPGGPGPR